MDIQQKKNEMEDILQHIIGEYNRLNDETISSNLETGKKMKIMSQNILSLDIAVKEKKTQKKRILLS